MTRRQGSVGLALASALWIASVAGGFVALICYGQGSGDPGAAPARWPVGSQIERSADRPTLLMFAHPRCPCTRASIRELERLMVRLDGAADVVVVFLHLAGFDEEWARTDLHRSASAIPGARVLVDVDGLEARRFAARTSGQTLVYDGNGALRFMGGITASRGHEGDNVGRRSALMAALDRAAPADRTPVFGCPLFDQAPCAGAMTACDEAPTGYGRNTCCQ